MTAAPGIRMKRPAHSGGFVKNEIIAPLGLNLTEAAEVPGVADATGEAKEPPLRVTFDRRLKLEFHSARITSDGGLLVEA